MRNIGRKTMNDRIIPIDDYYCSMKFRFLKVDLQRNTTANCHAATPHSVDFDWLAGHRGQLFNTAINVSERQQMLVNERPKSCEQNCWHAEERGAESPRMVQGGRQRIDAYPITRPTIMDLTLDFNCNLSCSYCSKEYSSTWLRDVLDNGDYAIEGYESDRFSGNARDRIMVRASQDEFRNNQKRKSLLDECMEQLDGLEKLVITGGEPFLSKELTELLEKAQGVREVIVYTGLGVGRSRFEMIVDRIKDFDNVTLWISMENIDDLLEFNRYGLVWQEAESKIEHLRKAGIRYQFQSTLSNLTLFGFGDFYRRYAEDDIVINFAYQPRFMAPWVMDRNSKEDLLEGLHGLPSEIRSSVQDSIARDSDESEGRQLGQFLLQYIHRREDLDLRIFPKTFLKWMDIHVV